MSTKTLTMYNTKIVVLLHAPPPKENNKASDTPRIESPPRPRGRPVLSNEQSLKSVAVNRENAKNRASDKYKNDEEYKIRQRNNAREYQRLKRERNKVTKFTIADVI